MVMEDLTLGDGHTMHIQMMCTLENYVILLTNVSVINLIKVKEYRNPLQKKFKSIQKAD